MALAAVLLGLGVVPAAAEDITLTTYYPSPRGVYKELRVTDNAATPALSVTQTGTGAALSVTDNNTGAALSVTQTGTGTAFRVDDVAGDASPFIINDSGNVGIGTAAPAAHLDILEAGAASALTVTQTGTGSAFRVDDVAADASPFIILDTGNVGIGTPTPGARLVVTQTGSGDVFRVNDVVGDPTPFIINDSGNVGIGTAAPTAKLHVQSADPIVGSIMFGGVDADMGYNGGADDFFPFVHKGNALSGAAAFTSQNALNRLMTIANNGNVNVGPGFPPYDHGNGVKTLTVQGYIRSESNRMYLVGAPAFDPRFWINAGPAEGGSPTTNINGQNVIGFNINANFANRQIYLYGTTHIGEPGPGFLVKDLWVSGDAHAQSFQITSDATLKTNIVPLTDVLPRLDQLRGVTFDWKTERRPEDRRRQIGLLAQEVEAAFPELVATSEEGLKSVDYGKFAAVLLEAVKELEAQNAALSHRLDALERRPIVEHGSAERLP